MLTSIENHQLYKMTLLWRSKYEQLLVSRRRLSRPALRIRRCTPCIFWNKQNYLHAWNSVFASHKSILFTWLKLKTGTASILLYFSFFLFSKIINFYPSIKNPLDRLILYMADSKHQAAINIISEGKSSLDNWKKNCNT